MARHKDTLGQDSEGRFRRYIGWKYGNDKMVQHLFRLGRSEPQARIANVRLETLWHCVEERWRRLKAEGRTDAPCPLWDDCTLAIGHCIAKGDAICTVPVHPEVEEAAGQHPFVLTTWLEVLQKDFPGIPLQLPEKWRAAHQGVLDKERERADKECDRAQKEIEFARQRIERAEATLSQIGVPRENGPSLHQALDLFSEYVGKKYRTADGRISPTARLQQRQIRQIKDHQPDMPLSKFGLNEIEGLVMCWRNRPITKRGTPARPETVRDVIKRIKTFIRWLHRQPDLHWRKPADLEWERVRIPLSPAEVSAKATPQQVDTYTLDELAILYDYATPFERLPMLLALNCGFGQAEVLTLHKTEVKGEYIKRLRYKTQTYGEWRLWDVTQKGIAWMQQLRHEDVLTVIVTKDGKPVEYLTEGSNRSARLANAWAGLTKRVKKDHETFRELSFNKLRKTAGDMIRDIASGEVAGIFLCHGRIVSDALIEDYTNRNFAKVFEAIKVMGERLAPMFAKVFNPFPADYRKSNPALSLGKIRRIQELRRQGYKIAKIAELVGCDRNTASKWAKQDGCATTTQ